MIAVFLHKGNKPHKLILIHLKIIHFVDLLEFILYGILRIKMEASYFDQINMTKNGLEYDQIKFTPSNVKVWK